MKRFLLLVLVVLIGMSCQTVMADPPDVSEVDEIQLRDPLELEKAVMEYMLAFEAYRTARRSKDPNIRGNLVKLMQDYRNSYAKFLEMLRTDKLYKPGKPKDPAGWYEKTDAKALRAQVKEMVRNGSTPSQVKAFIQGKLPVAPLSIDPGFYTAASTFPPNNFPTPPAAATPGLNAGATAPGQQNGSLGGANPGN
jgi:hypothetical protein